MGYGPQKAGGYRARVSASGQFFVKAKDSLKFGWRSATCLESVFSTRLSKESTPLGTGCQSAPTTLWRRRPRAHRLHPSVPLVGKRACRFRACGAPRERHGVMEMAPRLLSLRATAQALAKPRPVLLQAPVSTRIEAIEDFLLFCEDHIRFRAKPVYGQFLAEFDRHAIVLGLSELPQPVRRLA